MRNMCGVSGITPLPLKAARKIGKLAGMAHIRQLPSGAWRAEIRIKGHRTVSATRRTKAEVQAWVTQTEAKIRNGSFVDTQAAEGRTLADHLHWYLSVITPKKAPSALKRDESRVRILLDSKALGRTTLASLSAERIVQYVDERKACGLAADSIRKELGTLSAAIEAGTALLKIAMPHGNPVTTARGVLKWTRALPPGVERERRISPAEEALLLDALAETPIARAAVLFLLETGLRRQECCSMRHEDLKGALLFVRQGKSEARTIPLSPKALEAIRQLPRCIHGQVFQIRPDSLTQAFSRACKRSGIKDLRIHDLRHEATARFFEVGLSVPEVALITGHSDWKSLKRYTQLRPEDVGAKLRNPRKP